MGEIPLVKRTVRVILSDSSCKQGNDQFTYRN